MRPPSVIICVSKAALMAASATLLCLQNMNCHQPVLPASIDPLINKFGLIHVVHLQLVLISIGLTIRMLAQNWTEM